MVLSFEEIRQLRIGIMSYGQQHPEEQLTSHKLDD